MNKQDWIEEVRHKPWVDRATGPDAFDCWGLVVDYFARVKGVRLPDVSGYKDGCVFLDGMNQVLESGAFNRSEIQESILFTRFVGDDPTHIGLILGDRIVHALGTIESGGQVYDHTMTHIRRLFSGSRLEFWSYAEDH